MARGVEKLKKVSKANFHKWLFQNWLMKKKKKKMMKMKKNLHLSISRIARARGSRDQKSKIGIFFHFS